MPKDDEQDLRGVEVAEGQGGPGAAAGRDDEMSVIDRIDATKITGVAVADEGRENRHEAAVGMTRELEIDAVCCEVFDGGVGSVLKKNAIFSVGGCGKGLGDVGRVGAFGVEGIDTAKSERGTRCDIDSGRRAEADLL